MDLRNTVKTALRMSGHAVVSTVHERLNGVEWSLQQIQEQNTHVASTQTALLQAGVHLVEAVQRIQDSLSGLLRDSVAGKQEIQTLQAAIEQLREYSVGREEFAAIREQIAVGQEILTQNAHLADTQSALLQSNLHLVQTLADLQPSLNTIETRVAARVREYCAARTDVQALGVAFSETKADVTALDGSLNSNFEALRSSLASIEPTARATNEFLVNQSVRQVCVETSDYFFTNPELGLLTFLYSYLPSRAVLDVGANVGDVSEHLLNAGYEVYAFEPYPDSYRRLTERLGARQGFHSFNLALGSVTGELPLHKVEDQSPGGIFEDTSVYFTLIPHGMPDGLSFQSTVPVKIRTLAELHQQGGIPEDASLVKIDTEGYDLEVIRGMGDRRYPVVMAEFWDIRIPFATQGLLYTAETIVREMRQRGYLWYVVIYRIWGQNETAFFCNHERSIPDSWGNIIFFQDRELFLQAQQWCSAVLPRTYFKHVPAAPEENHLSGKAAEGLKA